MNNQATFLKVGFATLQAQLIWALWFLGIMLVVNIIRLVLSNFGVESDYFYAQLFISSNIFMLIVGIITIYFLPFYVENGVTRKDYFYGNVIAALGLSLLIPIGGYVITFVEKLIFPNFRNPDFSPVFDHDGNIIGDLIQSVILTPYVDVETSPFLSLVVFSINILGFYLIGWMIGAAFYRLGVIGGLFIIVLGLVFIAFKDSMMRIALDLPMFEFFKVFQVVPQSIAFFLGIGVIVLILFIIRLLTKRAPIKI